MEEDHKSKIVSMEEFPKLLKYITEFSRVHNPKSDDCKFILELAARHRDDLPKFQALCRTSILSFFTLIEADIYYYNLFDKFKGYKDKLNFFEKFEPTFQQICGTWQWPDLLDEYLKRR